MDILLRPRPIILFKHLMGKAVRVVGAMYITQIKSFPKVVHGIKAVLNVINVIALLTLELPVMDQITKCIVPVGSTVKTTNRGMSFFWQKPFPYFIFPYFFLKNEKNE